MIAPAMLLAGACVLPPESAGDDDDGDSFTSTGGAAEVGDGMGHSAEATGNAGDGSDGSASATDTEPGEATEGDTGDPGCSPLGPAGLPGVNPGFIWVTTLHYLKPTVAKIDTETMMEVARYRTTELEQASPESVAVSLSGNPVVADSPMGTWERGELTKFYGDLADCVDVNGDGVITTSSGINDVLPWDQEECRAWSLPLDYRYQAPAVWTPGVFNMETCKYENEMVWSGGIRQDDESMEVILVDGEAGTIVEQIPVDVGDSTYGLFTLAVDAAGNLWGTTISTQSSLTRIDRETFEIQTWPVAGSWSLSIGRSGYVFACGPNGVARFDPTTETWTQAPPQLVAREDCMEDHLGRLWLEGYGEVTAVDVETFAVVETVVMNTLIEGIAMDFEGRLWGTGFTNTSEIHRVDLDTGVQLDIDHITMVNARTSDMTGFLLANLVAP